MTGVESAAVIGLGLIGGSLARDLAAMGVRVLAHDTDDGALQAAVQEGILAGRLRADLSDAADVDVIVVAVPVQHAADVLARIARCDRGRCRLVTDVGSTKSGVLRLARELALEEWFVGGHPLTGSQHGGWAASRARSFTDASVYLCRGPGTNAAAVDLAHDLWRAVGGRPVEIDAAAHDELVACTSHLPQAASSALARVLAAAGVHPTSLGPGGRDMTRLAGSGASLWAGIAVDNAGPLITCIDSMTRELGSLRAALADGSVPRAQAWFDAGAGWTAQS